MRKPIVNSAREKALLLFVCVSRERCHEQKLDVLVQSCEKCSSWRAMSRGFPQLLVRAALEGNFCYLSSNWCSWSKYGAGSSDMSTMSVTPMVLSLGSLYTSSFWCYYIQLVVLFLLLFGLQLVLLWQRLMGQTMKISCYLWHATGEPGVWEIVTASLFFTID